MKTYLALIKIDLLLAGRNRSVLFFNYLFPLIFFFAFSEMMSASRGGVSNIVTMVLTIGILGNGLWGAGMRAVQERENNILRRYKVTPITPTPLLVSSMITGWFIYLPAVLLICGLAHFIYGMPVPENWLSLGGLITLGIFAFRAIGLIIASTVNTVQESTIAIQLFYMPMLFLSGSTIPVTMLPGWAQIVSQFLPASYLVTGLQGVFLRKEPLWQNWPAVLAMAVTVVLATFVSVQLFRWEKEEKLRPRAKLWVLAVLSPFVILGSYQAYSKDQIARSNVLWRDLMRNDTFLIRGARIFVGDGRVIESGSVLVKNGKIEEVLSGAPDAAKGKADTVEAAGKTLLPGLIDAKVSLMRESDVGALRALAAYLYCGVTAVNVRGGPVTEAVAKKISSGQRLGAEVFSQSVEGAYAPALTAVYGRTAEGWETLLSRSLVEQVAPKEWLEAARGTGPAQQAPEAWTAAREELLHARDAGKLLVTGSGAGSPPVAHGPTVQEELRLWVQAGIPAAQALQAATHNAAKALHAEGRIGLVQKGYEASLLLVEGNPLIDIAATESISLVVYKGERLRRGILLDQK